MSSQDYLYDRGITSFGSNYLGVASFTNDVTQLIVTGAGPAFGGLGPYTLNFPFGNYTDVVTPTASAAVAFTGNVGSAALYNQTDSYRTTFWAFPFEALPVDDRNEVMQAALDYCGGIVGAITGTVTDGQTGDPIDGATVSAPGIFDYSAVTNASGAYTLTLPVGAYDVSVASAGYFDESEEGVTVAAGETLVLDFAQLRPYGELQYSPGHFEQSLAIGERMTHTLTITNSGTITFDFTLADRETGSPLSPSAPAIGAHTFDEPTILVAPEDQNAATAAALNLPATTAVAAPLAAGAIIDSWDPGFSAWGIAFDGEDVWVSRPGPNWGGDATLHNFAVDGTPAGVSHPYTWSPDSGPADLAFNWNTGNLWALDVGGDNCIHEMSPTSGATGATICPDPAFPISQRGLAYDPVTDTYFAGSWNDSIIYHFDSTGAILSQTSVGLEIAGLAYNPDTQHLFVMANSSPNPIYVLDAADSFANLGQFSPASGFGDFAGAGLEIDCDGNLWALDQVQQTVYLIESGESTTVCGSDAPWLHQAPDSGTVDPLGGTFEVEIVFDTTAITTTGTYTAELFFGGTFENTVARPIAVLHVEDPDYTVSLASDQTASGEPEDVIAYTATVTNEGNATNTVNLALSGGTWPSTLSHASVALLPGASAVVTVEVTIPAHTFYGLTDAITLTATSAADPTAEAAVTFTTTVPGTTLFVPFSIKS